MEGQFIVLDKEKKVVVIASDSEVIVNDEYQVIFDQKEEYRFIDCGNGVIKVVKEKTPQDVLDQGERLMYKDVCEIKETNSVDEVNVLLNDQKNKWKLLTIVPHKEQRLFIIGRF